MTKWSQRLAAHWATNNPAEVLITSAGVTASLMPVIGFVPRTAGELLALYRVDPAVANWICLGLWGVAAPVMLAKTKEQWKKIRAMFGASDRYRGVWIGDTWVHEKDFWTHILVTGMTGSGKTSAVMMPVAKQLFDLYNDEDIDPLSLNPYKKIGMYVLEVKGTFFEYIVYLVHESGRNATKDVVLFRPDPRYPVAHFVDEKGRHWYLNAYSHTWRHKVTSSEAHQLYVNVKRPNGEFYPPTLFVASPETAPMWEEIRKIDVPVTWDMRFVGWRREQNNLIRVSRTETRSVPEPLEVDGRPLRVDAPKTLRFVDVIYVNSGLRTNIVKPHLPPSEAASRLGILAKMAKRSEKGDSQNDFFYEAAEKQMQYLITLHRYVHAARGEECTAADIVRLTTDAQLLETYLQQIENKTRLLKAEIDALKDPEDQKVRIGRELQPMMDLIGYFNNEWKKHQQGEGKVANGVNGVITNAFGRFLSDPNLRETFCSPQTVDYRKIPNLGRILCFVPGKEYETLQKPLAVDSKMDFIAMGNARKYLGLDMVRPVCKLSDEAHEYIISHDTLGDNKALSQFREFRIFYFCGTQSDAWVDVTIGQNNSKVYRQSFAVRVFLRNTDEDTNRRASNMCGTIKVEDREVRQRMSVTGMLTKDGEFHGSQDMRWKDKPYIKQEDFGFLPNGEGIVWYACGKNREEQVRKTKFPFAFCTSEEGEAAVGDRLRHYFRELMENLLYEQGLSYRVHHDGPRQAPAAKASETVPAPQHTPVAAASPYGSAPKFTSTTPLSAEIPVPSAVPLIAEWRENHQETPAIPVSAAKEGPRKTKKEPGIEAQSTPAPGPAEVSAKPTPTILTVTQAPVAPLKPAAASVAGGITKRAIKEHCDSYKKFVGTLDSLLDQMDIPPVINAKVFHAEQKHRLAAKHKSEAELEAAISTRVAAGQTGKTIGASDIAAKMAPVPTDIAKTSAMEVEALTAAEQQRREHMQMAADLMSTVNRAAPAKAAETLPFEALKALF